MRPRGDGTDIVFGRKDEARLWDAIRQSPGFRGPFHCRKAGRYEKCGLAIMLMEFLEEDSAQGNPARIEL